MPEITTVNPDETRALGRSWQLWENNIKIFPKIIALKETEGIYVAEHTGQWHSTASKVVVDLWALSKRVKV
jgi:hypothetical protein